MNPQEIEIRLQVEAAALDIAVNIRRLAEEPGWKEVVKKLEKKVERSLERLANERTDDYGQGCAHGYIRALRAVIKVATISDEDLEKGRKLVQGLKKQAHTAKVLSLGELDEGTPDFLKDLEVNL